MSEYRQMSLRECALDDASKYGEEAVKQLKEKQKERKRNRRKGVKTNVGDPNRKR